MAKIKLLDGAMGTNLIAAGMPKGTCTEKWILENSDVVKNLQSEYINGGSDIIYAPTFGANSAVLAREGDLDVSINGKLVALTKELADGKNVLVAGDISSTGLMLKPYGSASFEDVVSVFAEQAA
ncbi:MAG: homocysteine S-methyltransferase family protein, partial [Clostridia bacterium]|nr:homocysteine S-methyltransferase family protein [Clostridia bacterium]